MTQAFNGLEKSSPVGGCRQDIGASLTRLRLGSPWMGCFPAAPNSVSPSNGKYRKIAWQMKEVKYTAARFPVMDVVGKHHPSEPHSRAIENDPQFCRAVQVVRLQEDSMGRSSNQDRDRDIDRAEGEQPSDSRARPISHYAKDATCLEKRGQSTKFGPAKRGK